MIIVLGISNTISDASIKLRKMRKMQVALDFSTGLTGPLKMTDIKRKQTSISTFLMLLKSRVQILNKIALQYIR